MTLDDMVRAFGWQGSATVSTDVLPSVWYQDDGRPLGQTKGVRTAKGDVRIAAVTPGGAHCGTYPTLAEAMQALGDALEGVR